MENFISNDEFENREQEVKEENTEKVVSINEGKQKRPAFVLWNISDSEQLKLKLTTQETLELEKKFRTNLISLMGDENSIPPLTTMLQVVHGAAITWQHGLKLRDVQGKYDRYVRNGGNLLKFYAEVYIQIFMVSGFFSESITEDMEEKTERMQDII